MSVDVNDLPDDPNIENPNVDPDPSTNGSSPPRKTHSAHRYAPGVDGRKVPKPAYVANLMRQEYFESQKRHWKRNFLRAYSARPVVGPALQQAGVTRKVFNQARIDDPKFAEAFEEAFAAGTDKALEAVWEIGVEGVREPIVWQGEIVGYKRTKDWKAAKFILETREPQVYSQRERIARIGALTATELASRRDDMLTAAEDRIKMFASMRANAIPAVTGNNDEDDGDDD